jgi:hypothetical protein
MNIKLFSTDSLPLLGGTTGAITQVHTISYTPTLEVVCITIILSALGATVGYLIKLLLDYLFSKTKKKQ